MATTRKTTNPLDIYANANGNKTPKSNNVNPLKQNLLERQAGINKNISNLIISKYGNQANPSLGYNQPNLTPIGGWNDIQETQGLSQYNKYMDDLYNTRNALEQYGVINQQDLQGKADANIVREQGEKYLPNQLQMVGMGNVGTSESSRVGLNNAYQRNVSDINAKTRQSNQDMFGKYNQALLDSERTLSDEQATRLGKYQEANYENAIYNIQQQRSVDDINRLISQAKGKMSNDQYLDLIEKAKIVARALGYDLDGKKLSPTINDILNLENISGSYYPKNPTLK